MAASLHTLVLPAPLQCTSLAIGNIWQAGQGLVLAGGNLPQVDPQQGLPAITAYQGDVDPFFQSSPKRLVNIPQKVGSSQHHDQVPLLARQPIHLDQQYNLDPPVHSSSPLAAETCQSHQ